MSEANNTLDFGGYQGRDKSFRAIFVGMDWGYGGWTALLCPRCSTRHQWQKRRPRFCRHCGLPFRYTASQVHNGQTEHSK